MTPNRRIFLNIIATYARSLYALVLGLFTARWALAALGQVDYGLMGVVGGLVLFISFLNNISSISVGRFFAYSVGAAFKQGALNEGFDECRKWFTVAVSIHTILPLILMILGYPLGIWAIKNYLNIPVDRIDDCVWVFRFVCLTCFISMVSVPFNAMYTAKQYIAELTIYSYITTTLNALFLYYMITHPAVWLVKYALWTCVIGLIPSLIIGIRAAFLFKECRILSRYLWSFPELKQLMSFAGWSFFGSLGNLLKGAGMSVLVNKMLGPSSNAAVTIANSLSSHTMTLSSSMVGAFNPAITNAIGAGDRARMISLVHKTCKFGAALVLPFAIPLALEIDHILLIWLKNPPSGVDVLCIWMMAVLVLENMTTGLWIAIGANGEIKWYQVIVGICFIATLPIAWIMMKCGLGIYSVGYSLFFTLAMVAVVRVVSAKLLLNLEPINWIRFILLPILVTIVISTAAGFLPSLFMAPSCARILITILMVQIFLCPLIMYYVLNHSERKFVESRVKNIVKKIGWGNG